MRASRRCAFANYPYKKLLKLIDVANFCRRRPCLLNFPGKPEGVRDRDAEDAKLDKGGDLRHFTKVSISRLDAPLRTTSTYFIFTEEI